MNYFRIKTVMLIVIHSIISFIAIANNLLYLIFECSLRFSIYFVSHFFSY